MRNALLVASFGAALFFACSSSTSDTSGTPDASTPDDDSGATTTRADSASPTDAADAADAADTNVPPGMCANTFGQNLTVGFGRIDGTVWAVQKPTDLSCTLPNSTHVVVQVYSMGAIYRLVANVQSDDGDPMIRSTTMPHALPAPAYQDGWHLGASLDYVTDLDAHSTVGFQPMSLTQATQEIVDALQIGAQVSVYATVGSTEPDSAHLIHRNKTNQDGAIVANPTSASPTFLLFHFDEQTF